jgi:putative ABC transport system permease protein
VRLSWYHLRVDLKNRWRPLFALALAVGLGGGVALAALAGARRSDEAMPQFLSYNLPDNASVVFNNPVPRSSPLVPPAVEARVLHLPQVVAWYSQDYLFLTPARSGQALGSLNPVAPIDAQAFRDVDRLLVIAGTYPRPADASQAAVNETAAQRLHLHVGSPLTLYAYAPNQFLSGQFTTPVVSAKKPLPQGPTFQVRIAAVVRAPSDVNAIVPLAAEQDVDYEGQGNLYLTPAFLSHYVHALGLSATEQEELEGGVDAYAVRLRQGSAAWASFSAAAAKVAPGVQLIPGNGNGATAAAASAERGIHFEAVALLLFGALAALVTLVLVGQALRRQVLSEDRLYATLRSLGADRRQIVAVVSLRTALVGAVGAVLAVVLAILISPLMPFGLARLAEIHPGFDADLVILIPGALTLVVLLVAVVAVAGVRVSRSSLNGAGMGASLARRSFLADWAASMPLPPAASIGIRFGLERGESRTAVPVGTAIVAAAVAVATLAAALTFGTSLNHLVASPTQQGWNWDVLVGNPNSTVDQRQAIGSVLAANDLVGSYSALTDLQGIVSIDGRPVENVLAFDGRKGDVYPPLLEGRRPVGAHEIVLGTRTLQQIHRSVGQSVVVSTPVGTVRARVVGRMIAPSVGDILTNDMGDGAWVDAAFQAHLVNLAGSGPSGSTLPPFVLFAVRYAGDAPRGAAFASLERDFGPTVLTELPAENVINLHSVDGLPVVLAGLVALLGIATVGSTVIAFVRRRQRDLAVLKTLGFSRSQVASTVGWQTTSFLLLALVIGIPVGVVVGRWVWSLVASQISSVSPALVPAMAVALLVPATLLIGIALAAIPARRAANLSPGVVLRGE